MAGCGDVNGDIWPDLIVGSPGASVAGPSSGQVKVYSGKDSTVLLGFDGSGPGDLLGFSVAGAADIDADHHNDVIFGAPGSPDGTNHGRAVVVSGFTGTTDFQTALATSSETSPQWEAIF